MKKKLFLFLLLGIYLLISNKTYAQHSRNITEAKTQANNPFITNGSAKSNLSSSIPPIQINVDEQCNTEIKFSWTVNSPLFNHSGVSYVIHYATACSHYGDVIYQSDWQTEEKDQEKITIDFEWVSSDAVNPPQACGLISEVECDQPIIAIVVYAVDDLGNSIGSGEVYDFICECIIYCPFCENGIVVAAEDIQGISSCPPADPCFTIGSTGKTSSTAYSPKNITLSTKPNPFSSETTIEYTLTEESNVSLQIFDLQGRVIAQLLDQKQQTAGKQQQTWNAQQLPSGVYYYQLNVDGYTQTKKLVKF